MWSRREISSQGAVISAAAQMAQQMRWQQRRVGLGVGGGGRGGRVQGWQHQTCSSHSVHKEQFFLENVQGKHFNIYGSLGHFVNFGPSLVVRQQEKAAG